ncbi:nuclear transport factor 2 family protein [Bradyrhizobium jicamae]|uniref:nuclear transport factor 2 family protein n=1 Tax=Bradyrhizobium jicamae TaxID=280332 RepID=UPI001BA81E3A|nr:nuclear transport factor 2 family protein [Bradyrhizobium jicamae]MBR0751601.1 nuclear transport factor 2 family protein [Bradyrhizobium jicamae]
MTDHTALATARIYVEAIVDKDVERIISLSADDVVCTSPIGRIVGTQAFRGFHGGFARMLKKVTVLAAYGDADQAIVVYSAETHPVPSSVVAELIKVRNGKIASTDVIYDATPFAAYMATARPH